MSVVILNCDLIFHDRREMKNGSTPVVIQDPRCYAVDSGSPQISGASNPGMTVGV